MIDLKETWASLVALVVMNPPAKTGDLRDAHLVPRSERSPEAGHGLTTQVFLPGESHGQRRPAGCSPWSHKESDITEHMNIHTHPEKELQ